MGKVSDYGFAIAKLRARIGLMRDSSVIDDMIKAPTLAESINALSNTRHSSLVEVYTSTGDLQQVELKLFSDEVDNYKDILQMLPRKSSDFIRVLLEKQEIENLKNALRLWYSEAVRHHSIRYRSAYLYKDRIVYQINWVGIINAPTFDYVLQALVDTPYFDVLSHFSYEMISSNGLFKLEIALDQYYFKTLFSSISKLSRSDRRIAKKPYMVDADLKNILLLVRYGYYHDIPKEEFDEIIIPYGNVYQEFVKAEATRSEDLIIALRKVIAHKYPVLVQRIDDIRRSSDDFTTKNENAHQILLIENYLSQIRKKEYTNMLLGNVFSIGIVLAYFFLANREDSMIRAIISAKFYKWSDERIREAVGL